MSAFQARFKQKEYVFITIDIKKCRNFALDVIKPLPNRVCALFSEKM